MRGKASRNYKKGFKQKVARSPPGGTCKKTGTRRGKIVWEQPVNFRLRKGGGKKLRENETLVKEKMEGESDDRGKEEIEKKTCRISVNLPITPLKRPVEGKSLELAEDIGQQRGESK